MQAFMPDAPANPASATPATRARAESPYSTRDKVRRALWMYLGQCLFRMTFHNWYGLRRALLRRYGAKVGPSVRIRNSVRIEQPWNLTVGENSSIGDRAILYCLGPVTLGRNVSISQHAHLCAGTHDYTRPDMPLLRPPITIHDDAWIAADAFVGPDVTVGQRAILGARGVAMHDLDPWGIYAGNPAKKIKDRPRF
jgi:putative colanic acid biosynthesis acetyltransferase WcaF